jgi:hypothetical protein
VIQSRTHTDLVGPGDQKRSGGATARSALIRPLRSVTSVGLTPPGGAVRHGYHPPPPDRAAQRGEKPRPCKKPRCALGSVVLIQSATTHPAYGLRYTLPPCADLLQLWPDGSLELLRQIHHGVRDDGKRAARRRGRGTHGMAPVRRTSVVATYDVVV